MSSECAQANSSGSRARIATLAAWSHIWRAICRPRPREPPVMSATLSRYEKRAMRKRRTRNAERPTPNGKGERLCSVLAVEASNFAGGLAINGALLQVGAFVAGLFAGANTELGFHFAIFPKELQNDERTTFDLRFAIKFIDLLSM